MVQCNMPKVTAGGIPVAASAPLRQIPRMAKVTFTANLMRHVDCPSVDAQGVTVREVLAAVFAENPRLKSYVVDEQFSLRRHMGIIVDGEIVMDRRRLSDPVESNSEVFVLQALSGG